MLSPKPQKVTTVQEPLTMRLRRRWWRAKELARFWRRTARRWRWVIAGTLFYLVMFHLVGGWPVSWLAIPYLAAGLVYSVSWGVHRQHELEKIGREPETLRQLATAWWAERQRVDRVRDRWVAACEGYGLVRTNGRGKQMGRKNRPIIPKLLSITTDVNLDVRVLTYPESVQVKSRALIAAKEDIAATVGCIEIIPRQTDKPGVLEIGMFWTDPLQRRIRLAELPLSPKRDLFSYGVRRDGRPLLALKNRSWLVGGMTGMGKSMCMWAALASLLADGEWVDLYVSDTKRTELVMLRDQIEKGWQGRLRVRKYVNTPEATVKELLPAVKTRIQGRQTWMASQTPKVRNLDRSSQENPIVVVIIDEITHISDELKKGASGNLGMLISMMRAALGVVWMGTQDARVDTIPSSLRTLITTRTAFGVDVPESTTAILGKDAENRGARCSELKEPGLCYAGAEDSRYFEAGRVPFVSDREVAMIAEGRVPSGMLSRHPFDAPRPCYLYRVWEFERPDGTRRYAYTGETWGGAGTIPAVIVEPRFAQHRDMARKENFAWCPEHRRTENWWAVHVDESTLKLERYASKREAQDAERKAIKAERPYWNRKHNWDNRIAAINAVRPRVRAKVTPADQAQPLLALEPVAVEPAPVEDGWPLVNHWGSE